MTKKNEIATIRENENGTVHTVTKTHRQWMCTNPTKLTHQTKWVWVAEDGSEWTRMCGEWRKVIDRKHWYSGNVIGKEASNEWGDRAETVEPEVEETPEANVEGLTYVGTTANGEDLFEEAEQREWLIENSKRVIDKARDKIAKANDRYHDPLRRDAMVRYWQRQIEREEEFLRNEGVTSADPGEPEFAELTPEQEAFVEDAGIGRAVVTREQADRVVSELRLSDMGAEALTGVRNAVVLHLSDLMSDAREHGDWDAFDRLSRNMSGICTVIDFKTIGLR